MSTTQIPAVGFLRLTQIIGSKKNNIPPLFPVSRSTWLAGVKSGRYPAAIKLGMRSVGWRVEDVLALIANPQIS